MEIVIVRVDEHYTKGRVSPTADVGVMPSKVHPKVNDDSMSSLNKYEGKDHRIIPINDPDFLRNNS